MSFARTSVMRALLEEHDGVVSFDVFDTLLWRRYPRPVEVFHDIPRAAARLGLKLPAIDGASFATARRAAEAAARARIADERGVNEVTLRQVHRQLALALGWAVDDDALLAHLRTAELATEAAALVADHELLTLVGELAATGRRMVLVSDTYFSATDIRELVTGAGYPDGAFERTFVSSAFGVSKSCGLFKVMIGELDLRPARLLHVGDLPGADVTPLQELGGRAIRWPVARDEAIALAVQETGTEILPMRVCAVGAELTAGDGGITALRARVIPPDDLVDAGERVLTGFERFGRLIYGPALVGFANWLCDRAAELGLEKLHMFQREGPLLAQFVRRVAEARRHAIELTVLDVSRAALAPARHEQVTVGYLSDLLYGRRPRPAAEVATALGVCPDELPGWTADRRVTLLDAPELYGLLVADEQVMKAAQTELQRRRAGVHRYLEATVALDTDQVGVVDLGWAGSIQRSLSSALTQLGFAGTLRGFYLATNDGARGHLRANSRIEGFIAHLGYPDDLQPFFRNLEIIEQSCLARGGSIIGFDDDGTPQRAHDDIEPNQWNAIARVQDGARSFLDEWAAHQALGGRHGPADDIEVWRIAVRQALLRFCARPSRQEIELFRTWRHDDNMGARSVEALVPTIFEERSQASAMLAGVLGMDELLWASAVSTLNGGEVRSEPVAVSALISDIGQHRTAVALTAVGRRADNVIAAYLGAEGRRLGSVRIAIACGPSLVRLRRINVEVEDPDGSVTDQFSTFQQVSLGRGASAIAPAVAVVRARELRLAVPLEATSYRLGPNQRLRVLVELEAEAVHNRLVRAVLVRVERVARSSARRLRPHAIRALEATSTDRIARRLVRALRKSRVARSITRR
jgi:FMN phosphatase YigB (HAD superfamily)